MGVASGDVQWLVWAVVAGVRERLGVWLPDEVIDVDVYGDTLFVRFAEPVGSETDVEPLPTDALTLIFRDEAGRVTALETVSLSRLLVELGVVSPGSARGRETRRS